VSTEDLARVQKEREFPTRVIQAIQSFIQQRVIAGALRQGTMTEIPWQLRTLFRVPGVAKLPARLLAFGVKRVRLQEAA
jgi:hypothetical protein